MYRLNLKTRTQARRLAGLLAIAFALVACGEEREPDAYGNFETTEVVVAAEVGGELPRFDVEEGQRLPAGQVVGVIDTTQLALEREELQARRAAIRARVAEVRAQADVVAAEQRLARRELDRSRRLYADKAATAQQLDRAEAEVQVLDKRIQSIRAQSSTVEREVAAIDARLAQVEDRIRKSRIVNPVAGTVLTTYVNAHEFVQAGAPVYKIADLDTMVLRAYVTGAQLSQVRIGQAVDVLIDQGDERRPAIPGTVRWIASQAEFTPTPIQTREERVELVYAFEVRVRNTDGVIKIGMPGEVRFRRESSGETTVATVTVPRSR